MVTPVPVWQGLAKKLMRRDPALAPIIRAVGEPTVELEPDRFRALVRSILSQQLAGAAARAITARFVALEPPFPTPAALLRFEEPRLRGIGISARKASYLVAIAEAWHRAGWSEGWDAMSDEEVVERLTEIRGVGEWTAHMVLMFSMGRPDVLPVGDYGVRKGLQLLRGLREIPPPKRVPELVKGWEGMRSVGAWYLWRGLDRKLLVETKRKKKVKA